MKIDKNQMSFCEDIIEVKFYGGRIYNEDEIQTLFLPIDMMDEYSIMEAKNIIREYAKNSCYYIEECKAITYINGKRFEYPINM